MGTYRMTDPYEILRPPTAKEGEWRPVLTDRSAYAEHWRVYIGALKIDLYAPGETPNMWLVDAAPFFEQEMLGRCSADRAKVTAQAMVQGALHRHAMMMDGAL